MFAKLSLVSLLSDKRVLGVSFEDGSYYISSVKSVGGIFPDASQ